MGEVRLLYKENISFVHDFFIAQFTVQAHQFSLIARSWKKQWVQLRQLPAPTGGLLRVHAVLPGGTSYLWAPANLQNSSHLCWGAEYQSSVQI